MKKPTLILMVMAFIGAVYCGIKFKDWFTTRPIQISYRLLPVPAAGGGAPHVFLLDRKCPLTTVKILLEREAQTNRHPVPLWELITASNSVPITHLIYGATIPGMKPRYEGVPAETLKPGVEYRVEITSGKLHGQRTFTARAAGK